MRRYRFFSVACLSGLLVIGLNSFTGKQTSFDDKILSYVASLKSQDLKFYWRDDKGVILKSIQNLKTWLDSKQKTLVFATNGGIFMEDYTPLGLFIQEQKTSEIIKHFNRLWELLSETQRSLLYYNK